MTQDTSQPRVTAPAWPLGTILRGGGEWTGLGGIAASLLVALVVGVSVVLGERAVGPDDAVVAVVLVAAGIGSVVLALKTAWWPVVAYWGMYSVAASGARLVTQIRIGEFPVTIPDGAVALMVVSLLANAKRAPRQAIRISPLPFVGVCIFFDAIASALLGSLHGHQLYAILIDLRTLSYLWIGYLLGRLVTKSPGWTTRVTRIIWVTVIGFAAAELAVLLAALGHLQTLGGQITNYRDIGVPYFAGKYGLFLALITVVRRGFLRARWAFVLAVLGAAATLLSFVRTAWLGASAGLLVVAVIAVRRRTLFLVRVALVAAAVGASTVFFIWLSPAGPSLLEASGSRLTQGFGGSNDTVAFRITDWSFALAQLRGPLDWLVGRGLGLPGRDSTLPYIENSFVWLLAKEGLIGLTIFSVGILLIPIWWGYSAIVRNPGHTALLLVLVSAQVGNIASGFASGSLLNWEFAPLVGMTVAWIEALSHPPVVAETREDPPR